MLKAKRRILAFSLGSLVVFVAVLATVLPSFMGKEVGRVSLNQKIELKHVLDSTKELELVFFGYSGCLNVCTPRLEALALWYKNTQAQDRVGVRFIDVSSPKNKALPLQFAQAFNKDFLGVYLNPSVVREYARVFKVYFAQALWDKTEYDHTAHLYLVQRKEGSKRLRVIYTAYPFNFKQINQDILELLDER